MLSSPRFCTPTHIWFVYLHNEITKNGMTHVNGLMSVLADTWKLGVILKTQHTLLLCDEMMLRIIKQLKIPYVRCVLVCDMRHQKMLISQTQNRWIIPIL